MEGRVEGPGQVERGVPLTCASIFSGVGPEAYSCGSRRAVGSHSVVAST